MTSNALQRKNRVAKMGEAQVKKSN